MSATAAAETAPRPGSAADPLAGLPLRPGHAAIIGLQWGDEGKGQIVDVLTGRYDLVVRYNGGANAGHTVMIGGEKFALHLLPSGILSPHVLNVVGNGVVVDPQAILEEIEGLRQRGVKVADNLRISDRAHVVFPYHKLQDVLLDRALGDSRGEGQKIGTTGRGIGPCYADKAQRSTAIRMGELLEDQHLSEKLRHIARVKNLMLEALAHSCGQQFEPLDAEALARQYAEYGRRLAPYICDTTHLLHEAMTAGKRLLFEGANACLLDVDHGTYPFVTSSNCSSLGIYAGSSVPGGQVTNVLGVVKTYTSRVGGGPMPTELFDETGERLRKVGNEYGTTTGRPRRCGWLDLMAVRYSAMISGATGIACTGLSVLAGLPQLKVCVGYRHQGRDVTAFPAAADVLAAAEPVYETLEGFAGPVDGCRRFGELPGAAQRYLRFVEEFVGVPVVMACVGRRRDQILVR